MAVALVSVSAAASLRFAAQQQMDSSQKTARQPCPPAEKREVPGCHIWLHRVQEAGIWRPGRLNGLATIGSADAAPSALLDGFSPSWHGMVFLVNKIIPFIITNNCL